MADYISAFRQGLSAAESSARAKEEIDAVFDDLNKQLTGETGGKINIDRKEQPTPKSIEQVISGMSSIFEEEKFTYWAIVAFNPSFSGSNDKILAKWSMGRAGYPCKIVWGDHDYYCEDREALENSLAELLRDPLVGEQLQALMQS